MNLVEIYPGIKQFDNYRSLELSNLIPDDAAVGVLSISGWLELLDFRYTGAYERSKNVDYLAVFFTANASIMTDIGSNDRERFVIQKEYHEFPVLIRALISGIELQLVHRVIAIGGIDDNQSVWIGVPKSNEERNPKNTLKSFPPNH